MDICDIHDSNLSVVCERFSNNGQPAFTDQEVIIIYLYTINIEKRLKIKQIHNFANEHLRSWFPLLPSYEAFIMRINRLYEAFKILTPVKAIKGQSGILMQRDKAANDLYSKAVSSIRQPIESCSIG